LRVQCPARNESNTREVAPVATWIAGCAWNPYELKSSAGKHTINVLDTRVADRELRINDGAPECRVLRKCIFPILREIVEQSKKQGCREVGIDGIIGPQGPTPAHYLAGKGWSAAPHRARATWLPLARTNVRLKANNF
jgi:hypothetical protein